MNWLTELTVWLWTTQQTTTSVYCTLDFIETQSTVHQTIRALILYDVIECDVMGRGQHAGNELLSLTRHRWRHTNADITSYVIHTRHFMFVGLFRCKTPLLLTQSVCVCVCVCVCAFLMSILNVNISSVVTSFPSFCEVYLQESVVYYIKIVARNM